MLVKVKRLTMDHGKWEPEDVYLNTEDITMIEHQKAEYGYVACLMVTMRNGTLLLVDANPDDLVNPTRTQPDQPTHIRT
jgi:hypothetical protein